MSKHAQRIVRVETKLTHLMNFLQCPVSRYSCPPDKVFTDHDVATMLIRIESKLQGLMLHEGLDPYARIQGHEHDCP